jgi:hypothetical protein
MCWRRTVTHGKKRKSRQKIILSASLLSRGTPDAIVSKNGTGHPICLYHSKMRSVRLCAGDQKKSRIVVRREPAAFQVSACRAT